MTPLGFAWRLLSKHPGFSATAILPLAVGIGATTAMFGVVYAFLLRPLPFAAPEQLVMLQSRSTKSGSDVGVNYLDFVDWREQSRSFSELAFFNLRWNGNLQARDGSTETLKTTFTTANLFSLLGVAPTLGRNLVAADDEPNANPVLLISDRVWKQAYAADPGIIGRAVNLDGTPRTVVGVMPAGFRFPSQTDLWVPAAALFASKHNRTWRADQCMARLKPGTDVALAQAELTLICARLAQQFADTNKEIGAAVIPLREYWTGGVRGSLGVLLAACAGVLLIACANVGQLLLARASSREQELLVRAALGATRVDLLRLLLSEAVLLAFAGSIGGIAIAFCLVRLVAAAIPIELPFWIRIDVSPAVLGFAIAVSCLSALVAGSLPAWSNTRPEIAGALKSSGAGNTGSTEARDRLRDLLTVAQVAVSIMLVVSASVVLRGLAKLRDVAPGFDARDVLMFEVNPTYQGDEPSQVRVDRFARLLNRIQLTPGVVAVAANNSPPFVPQHPWNRSEFAAEGQAFEDQLLNPLANFQTVSSDYLKVLRVPLLQGRFFDERDTLTAPPVCVVSRSLAALLWPAQSALGKRLKLGRDEPGDEIDWLTVVGVVGDVRHQALDGAAGPDVYKPTGQLAWKQLHFLVRTAPGVKPLSLASAIGREVAANEPGVGVFNFVALQKEIASSIWQPRLRGWLLSFFSLVSLLLAATGLYGLIAYRVTRRTREIGIRMALGATPAAVMHLVVRSAMQAVATGVAVGITAALLVSRLAQASFFGIGGGDFVSYAVACFLLALTGAIACWFPARRASLVNPLVALRAE
jgi:putative ABC transport system permease protein